ncbi:MAG TPA: hypothetical protein VMN39_09305 [Longimicrobiaceae bacterium]|nr:hypothetical protein [Longimicrobiaceae bacterium]
MVEPGRVCALLPALAVVLATAGGAEAQSLPAGWTAVADASEAANIRFDAMAPGWHLWPGPAALIYQPDRLVEGPFRVELDAHGFTGEPSGYGVFFGTPGPDAAEHDVFEVLLDNQGRFRLGHYAGREYHPVVPWTRHEAIAVPTTGAPAQNDLVLEVSADRLAVTVNGAEVTAFEPPAYFRFDGVVGIRVQEGASVHFTRMEVSPGR